MKLKRVWLLLPVLALTACGAKPEGEMLTYSKADSATDSIPAVPTGTQATVTLTETQTQTTAAPETTAAESAETTGTTASFEPAFTVSSTEESAEQGGEGGEEHAEDTEPLYFNYMFGEYEVAMRLAGGTYQVIGYDFTEALEHGVESLYYLQDADFDGDLDLCVPVQFSSGNIDYAIFLWNQQTAYYEEQPLRIVNPGYLPEQKQITSVQHESATESMLYRWAWDNGKLKTVSYAKADFSALTLTRTEGGTEQPAEHFDSADALEAAILAYLA